MLDLVNRLCTLRNTFLHSAALFTQGLEDECSDPDGFCGWMKKKLRQLHRHFSSIRAVLDSPLNRYLVMTTYYWIYLVLILVAVLKPLSMRLSSGMQGVSWYHYCLLIYALSMGFYDIALMAQLR